MKKAIKIIPLLVTLLLVSCQNTTKDSSQPANNSSSQPRYAEILGTVNSKNTINLFVAFPSKINKILVKNGQEVKKGDKLINLDTKEFQLEIKKNETDLLALKSLGSGTTEKKERIDTLQETINYMKEKLSPEYLKDNDIICTIENGIIAGLNHDEGEYVNSQTKLLTLYDTNSLIVKANIPENFIKFMKLDKEIDLSPVSDKSRHLKGKVSYISNISTQDRGDTTIPVEILVDKDDKPFIIGQTISIQIPLN